MLDINALPDDVHRLNRLLIEHHAENLAKDLWMSEQSRQIEHLRFQLAKLRCARFGKSLEGLKDIGQLPLSFEELKAAVAETERQVESLPEINVLPAHRAKPVRRKHLPEHFERIDEVIESRDCACPECGGP